MHRTEELTGVFDWEQHVFQAEDPEQRTIIGTLENGAVVKGRAPRGSLECGLTYRFLGRWTEHPKFGRQFHFTSFAPAMPAGERATVRYLAKGPGIGRARAQRIWDLFGERSLETVRTGPERIAAEIDGLTPERASVAAAYFREHQRLEKLTIEVGGLLEGRGFPRSLPDKVIREWGAGAPEVLRQQPYRLMQFTGAGFSRCDQLYLDMGLDPAAIERQAYCVWHALAADGDGHTWYPGRLAERTLRRSIAVDQVRATEALAWAAEHDLLAPTSDPAWGNWIAEAPKAAAELRLAEYVYLAEREAIARAPEWPELAGDDCLCSEHQRLEAAKAMQGCIGVLAGSPGTGKTFTLAQIIQAVQRQQGVARVAVCAPTGKAAVRASESLASQGLPITATTIHRLLGVCQVDQEGSRDRGWEFEHGEHNPLALDYLFVDESSMVDTTLLASLLSARPAGCRVLLIGDPHQLAPVGHGAPLRDLIAAGVSSGHLKEIRRNAGRIVRSCAEIRDRHRIRFSPELRLDADEPENLLLVERGKPEEQLAELEAFFKQLDRSEYDPIWDVQVVVPVNEKSPLARKPLNKYLQGLLNPAGETVENCPFRTGDKIVCLKNVYDMPLVEGESNGAVEPGRCFVANGEQAKVLEVHPGYLMAQLWLPDRIVRIPRGRRQGEEGETTAAGCQFDLAYAISVHKSQGSEWPIVLVILDDYSGARRVANREWIFTAISRAKQYGVCLGPRRVADAACRRSGLWNRKTFLREQIEAKRLGLLREAWAEDLCRAHHKTEGEVEVPQGA